MYRTQPRASEHRQTVPTCWPGAEQLVLRAARGVGRELGADAGDRPPVHQAAILRHPKGSETLRDQPQAGPAAHATAGLEAVCPKRSTSRPAPGHKVYPYLLRNMAITKPDQVWASDITYIPLQHGFLYLTAVMDLYSRNVLSWRLSNTLTGDFCLEALDAALLRARPEIFNTDQGAQFTATAFTSRLKKRGVAISMDGRGRALDNVFVE